MKPVKTRATFGDRARLMARLGIKMVLHDRLKLAGILFGVVFAVVLSNQQLGTFLGLIHKNTMFVENAGADLWIAPPATEAFEPAGDLSTAALSQARGAEGVAWAEPLLLGQAQIALPDGGHAPVQLVGTRYPRFAGGPWNVVAGSANALAEPDTVVFEDSQREDLGALNLGSRRELNGHLVSVGGFTWGLLPFGPPFAFAEYDTARMLLRTESDRTSFVLVGIEPGADAEKVKAELQRRVPEALVLTTPEYESLIVSTLLTRTPMGITFGTSTAFGLLIGFLIVSLLMFSAVVDHVREFGTLKALGVSNVDLAVLLVAQAIAFALFGSVLGVVAITRLGEAVRSAEFAMLLPPWLLGSSFAATAVLCMLATGFALARVRKVEPGMVFR